ncbi:MAG TPA: MYXO-CTERM sorting domain-containing protein [Polyangiaceae bacterium]|nr:MYXO-CTERM sorting domain-containing protein [Polyangiaceae bacterium]
MATNAPIGAHDLREQDDKLGIRDKKRPWPTTKGTVRYFQSHFAPRSSRTVVCVRLGLATLLASASLAVTARAKPFLEYLKPTPTVAPLSSASWGVAGVLPRDLSNGIESAKGAGVHPDYYYWDGQIIKAKDGKYHLFMSTFSGNTNFGTSWQSSDAYHAVSETNVLGPYARRDYIYSNGGSHKGHNVSAVELPDGSYAVIVSEVVPFTIYKSNSLDGPWTGCQPTSQVGGSNISLFPRHDGKFQIVERNGTIAIADTLCGTYVKQKPTCAYTQNPTDAQGNPVVGSIYPKRTSIPGVPNPNYIWQEDPHIWRSGGVYHVIYSGSGDRVGWHVYSTDGLNWKDNGYGWSPRDYKKIFCYEGTTTCTQWYKMERPGVVLQDGHPTHITWAVADVDKDNQVLPGSNHGTKIIVVPFDGVTFDKDFGVGGGGGSGTGGAGAGGGSTTGGAGGKTGTAGTAGSTGGRTSAGGSNSNGGSTSVSGTGGTTTVAAGTGGQAAIGGVSNGAGGAVAVGGAVSNGAGGQSSTGGRLTAGGAPASGSSNADAASDTSGCGCRLAGGQAPLKSLAVLVFVGLLGRRRSRRRTQSTSQVRLRGY